MLTYITRRLLLMIPTLFGITLITFLIVHLTPGDPIALKAQQESGGMRPGVLATEVIEKTRAMYGLDQPLPVQYGRWIKRIVTLDFGTSYQDDQPVLEKIKRAAPLTIVLNLVATILIYLIAIPSGIAAAVRAGGWWDRISAIVFYVLYALPSFWVAAMLIVLFAGGDYLNLFPLGGMISEGARSLPFWQQLPNRAWHLMLPLMVMTYGGFAYLARFGRSVMLDVIRQDYMRTARAKGLPRQRIIWRHGVRNALVPFITLLGTLLPGLLGGSIIIEQIFGLPGMGKLSFDAVMSRDYPVVMALATIDAVLTLIGLLISDILYTVVDPRVGLE